jgi:hypothetical protein
MENIYKSKLPALIITVFLATVCLPATVISGGSPSEEEIRVEADGLVVCPEPRPQICTQDYRPVCAQLQDGSFKTYSNGCSSCSDPNVVGYSEAACAAE